MTDEQHVKYNPAFEPIFMSNERYLMLKGGAGAGKSVAVAQKLVGRMINEHGHRFLVLRKHAVDVKRSVWDLVINVIEDCGHSSFVTINKTERRITHKISGSEFIFSGIDDPEKIKSIVGVTGIWCEEITEFDEGDVDQLDLRLRGFTPFTNRSSEHSIPCPNAIGSKESFSTNRRPMCSRINPHSATIYSLTMNIEMY